MNTKAVLAFCAVFALFSAYQVKAVEPLSVEELKLHCAAYPEEAESTDGQYCIRYIQGFIDGAAATDERVMLNVEAEYNRKETFEQRAMRMRGADRHRLQDRAARYAEFCLGQPIPLSDVVTKVVADLNAGIKTVDGTLARGVVYASLRKNYPCKPLSTDR